MFKQANLETLSRFRDSSNNITCIHAKVAIEDDQYGFLYTTYIIEGAELAPILAEADKTKQGLLFKDLIKPKIDNTYNEWMSQLTTDVLTATEVEELFGTSASV